MELVPLDALWISWTLQTTLGAVLLFALWGMRRVFRERTVGVVARGWLAYVVMMIAALVATAVDRAQAPHAWHLVVTAIEGIARVYMIVEWYPLATVLAGDPVGRRSVRAHATHAALAATYAAADILLERSAPWVHVHLMERVYPFAFAWLAIAALYRSRRAARNGAMLRWLALGYSLFFLRGEAINWLFGRADAAPMRVVVLVGVVQITHVAAFGVVCLVVALALERGAIVEQAARLRDAELRLMNARRLASLGELAARVAHDFSNVLMVVMGGVDLARTAVGRPAVVAQQLADVTLAAAEGRALIKQLLAFSRPISVDPKGCEVATFLEERQRNLALLAGASATVEVTAPPAGTRVGVDAGTLEQIVYNLVTNARDAMPNGGTVRISGAVLTVDPSRPMQESQLPAGKYVRLTVDDDGDGIPPELCAKIFEPFFTTKGKAGTGLGLATVYAIATQAKGDVAVTSVVGAGTRFDVFLPLV